MTQSLLSLAQLSPHLLYILPTSISTTKMTTRTITKRKDDSSNIAYKNCLSDNININSKVFDWKCSCPKLGAILSIIKLSIYKLIWRQRKRFGSPVLWSVNSVFADQMFLGQSTNCTNTPTPFYCYETPPPAYPFLQCYDCHWKIDSRTSDFNRQSMRLFKSWVLKKILSSLDFCAKPMK